MGMGKSPPCGGECDACQSETVLAPRHSSDREFPDYGLRCSICQRDFGFLCLLRSSTFCIFDPDKSWLVPAKSRDGSRCSRLTFDEREYAELQLIRRVLLGCRRLIAEKCPKCSKIPEQVSESRPLVTDEATQTSQPASEAEDTSARTNSALASDLAEIKKMVTVNSVTLSRIARNPPQSPEKPVPKTAAKRLPKPQPMSPERYPVYLCRLKDGDQYSEVLDAINCSNVTVESEERLSSSVLRINLTSPLAKRQILSQASLLKGHQSFGHVFIRDECSKASRSQRDMWKKMLFESRKLGKEIPATVVFDSSRCEYRLVTKSREGKPCWKEDYRPREAELRLGRRPRQSPDSSASPKSELASSAESQRPKAKLQRGRPQVHRRLNFSQPQPL